MKRFISLSGGVESTTMCILYGKGATAIWCDTGNEEPVLYERIDYLEQRLKEIHSGDFELFRIKPLVIAKGVECRSINEAALQYGFPGHGKRWCTDRFKIGPIDKFLSVQGPCELLIGFNADEEPGIDRTGNFMKCKNVTYLYPLHDDGHTRDECEEILQQYDLHPNFPVFMRRGGCTNCYFKTRSELKAKFIFDREGFLKDEAFEYQLNKAHNRKKFYAINSNAGTYTSVREECENEIRNWGIEAVKAMYKQVEVHKPCGAFCHR